MFRKGVTALAGKDLHAEFNQEITELKLSLQAMPYSPVKRRIMNAMLDHMLQTFNNMGVMNLSKSLSAMNESKRIISELGPLKQSHDDDFIRGVKLVLCTLPDTDKLREVLQREVETAERELAERRNTVRSYSTLAAIGVTLVLIYQHPLIGLAALGAEVSTLLSVDCGRLLDQALELYDSSGYADTVVNGQIKRQLTTTYKEAMSENNRVEFARPRI